MPPSVVDLTLDSSEDEEQLPRLFGKSNQNFVKRPIDARNGDEVESVDLTHIDDEVELPSRSGARLGSQRRSVDANNLHLLKGLSKPYASPASQKKASLPNSSLPAEVTNRFGFLGQPTPKSTDNSASSSSQPRTPKPSPAIPPGSQSVPAERVVSQSNLSRNSTARPSGSWRVSKDSPSQTSAASQLKLKNASPARSSGPLKRPAERQGVSKQQSALREPTNQDPQRNLNAAAKLISAQRKHAPRERSVSTTSSSGDEFPSLENLTRSHSATQSSSRPQSSSHHQSITGVVPLLSRPGDTRSKKTTSNNESTADPSLARIPPIDSSEQKENGDAPQTRASRKPSELRDQIPSTPSPPDSPILVHRSGRQSISRQESFRSRPTVEEIARRTINSEQSLSELMPLDDALIVHDYPSTKLDDIGEFLTQYQKTHRQEHSRSCRIALRCARSSIRDPTTKFRDRISPFGSMKSVQLLPGENAPDETLKVATRHIFYKKSNKKFYGTLLGKRTSTSIERVPKYTHHTAVRRNLLEGDDDKLKYIPFWDDDKKTEAIAKKLEQDMRKHNKQMATRSSRDSEKQLQRQIYISELLWYLNSPCDLRSLTSYILDDYVDDLELGVQETTALTRALGKPSSAACPIAENIYEAWQASFSSSLADVVLQKERIQDILESAVAPQTQIPQANTAVDVVDTYTDMCCLICNTMHCQVHGDYIDVSDGEEGNDEAKESQQHQGLHMHYQRTVQNHDNRVLSKLPKDIAPTSVPEPCSGDCYLKGERWDTNAAGSHNTQSLGWSDIETNFLKSITISRTSEANEAKRPCIVSFALKRPCWQVWQLMQMNGPRQPQPDERAPIFRGPDWEQNKKWYDNKTKRLMDKWRQWTDAHDHAKRGQPSPCFHPGPCRSGCPCFDANILCEFYCDCGPECPRKFTGCSCHDRGINCDSETCICVQMNRECGPECSSCGAVERINPDNKYNHELFNSGCQNVVLQRGVGKRVFIGKSGLEGAGYGLYIGETARKGDYLDEYAGETITWVEADRRGIIYDLKYTSYLFDLNNRWAIDADRLANKTRYMNHASAQANERNCDAKVMWVRGQHRIKFIAIRNIKLGEELLFNYGEKFAAMHGLDKKPNARKAKAKIPQEDDESVEKVLDNMQESARAGRRMAIRGGHNGRGRGRSRKARKTAGMSSPLITPQVPHIPSDDEPEDDIMADEVIQEILKAQDDAEMDPDFHGGDDEQEEEDSSDSLSPPPSDFDKYEGRRKRPRKMPARYRK